MGILNGKHVFASKHITAIIINDARRAFFVPIEHPIGNYFIAKLDKQLYAFRIDDRINTYHHTLAKTFQFTIYHTTHYLPVSELSNDLKLMLEKNGLSRVNGPFSKFLKFLGHMETHKKAEDFKPHDLPEIVAKLKTKNNPSPELINLMTFITELPVDKIVTPVRGISEFLEDDLKSTDPKYLGTIVTALTSTDYEHKQISNTPVTAKKPITKLLAVVMLIAVVGLMGYFMYEEGYLDDLIPGLGGGGSSSGIGGLLDGIGSTPNAPPSDQDLIIEKYSDPADLKLAVDRGEIPLTSLPKDIQKLLENIDLPEIIPLIP